MPQDALNQSRIEALRVSLETTRQELENHIDHVESASRPVTLDQQSVGRVSRIDAIQQQQMARANQEQATQQLKKVELALRRIETGEYGQCLHCEDAIAFARLQAQPFAGLCLECQSASESTDS